MKILIAGLLLAVALPVGAQRGGNRGGGGFGGQRNDPFGRNDPMRRNDPTRNSRLPREQKQKKEQKRPACVSDIAGTKFPKKKPEYICEQNKKGKWAWRKLTKEEKEEKSAN